MNSSNDQNVRRNRSSRQFSHETATGKRRPFAGRAGRLSGFCARAGFHLGRLREFLWKWVYWRQSRLEFCSASRCIKGCTCDVNADRCYADQRRGLFVLADGRELEGEQASQTVIEVLASELGAPLDDASTSSSELAESIKTGILQANRELMKLIRDDTGPPTIEAAVVVGIVRYGRLLLCSVGNSRAYLWRDNRLRQLTVDDTLVQRLVTAGSLTSREAARHPMRHVLSHSIGTQKLGKQLQVTGHILRDGDRLLLATDGLTHAIGEDQLSTLLEKSPDPATAATALTDEAREAGSRDDVTCVIVDLFA